MGMVRVGLVLCSLAGSFRRCAWGYSGYLLILLARLNGSLPLAILTHLPSLSEWFSVNVVTDGFAAFDKIRRCVANCRPQLRLFSQVGHLEQLSPVGMLLVSCR